MDSRLVKKDDDKTALEAELKNSRILERVREAIQQRKDSYEKTSLSDYDKPNWGYWRADMDGYIRALTDVLNLIKK